MIGIRRSDRASLRLRAGRVVLDFDHVGLESRPRCWLPDRWLDPPGGSFLPRRVALRGKKSGSVCTSLCTRLHIISAVIHFGRSEVFSVCRDSSRRNAVHGGNFSLGSTL
jgi:hypothetical protein